MTSTKFYSQLLLLSCTSSSKGNEFREFSKMSESPFFEVRGSVKRLVKYLNEHYYPRRRKFEKQGFQGECQEAVFKKEISHLLETIRVWKGVFPDQQFDEKRYRSLLSETNALLEKYFAYKAIFPKGKTQRKRKSSESNLLEWNDEIKLNLELEKMKFFLERGQLGQVEKRYHKAWGLLERKKQIDERWFELAYKIKGVFNDLLIRQAKPHDELTELSNYFDQYFVLQKLKEYCAMANRAHIFNKEYEYPLIEKNAIGSLSKHLSSNPLEEIYTKIFRMLDGTPSEMAIGELWTLVLNIQHQISNISLKQIAAFIRVNLQFIKKKGEEDIGAVNTMIFRITKFMDARGILGVNGKINPTQFISTVKASLAVRELQWTENFIKREARNLNGELTIPSINYAKKYLMFLNGQYLAAWEQIDALRVVPRNSVSRNFQIQVRCLKLKILYRLLDQDDPFFADTQHILKECESFRKMMSEDKIYLKDRKRRVQNFIYFTKRLVRMKEGKYLSQKEKQKIKTLIFRKPVEDKEWVWEVLREFEIY